MQAVAPDRFGPEHLVTREQLAQMLYYAAHRGRCADGRFQCSGYLYRSRSCLDWAEQAMAWAVSQKLISGKGNGILDPDGTATRAEVAAIFTAASDHGGLSQ